MLRHSASDRAFAAALRHVERAKEELVAAVPSPRGVPGRPVAEAVLGFEDELRKAGKALSAWDGRDDLRRHCAGAVDESLRRTERLRLEAPALDYEGLVTVLAELIAPLDAFAQTDPGA